MRGVHFIGGVNAVLRAGVHRAHKKHPPWKCVTVDTASEQNIHQLFVNAVFRAVDFVDKQDHGANRSVSHRVNLFLGRKIVLRIAIFIAAQRLVGGGFARQLEQPLFFRLNALHGVIRQKAETNLTVFVLVLIRQAGDFAFFQRAAFDGDAHAAQITGDAFHHLGFADAVLAGDQRRDGKVLLFRGQIGEQRPLDEPFGFVNANHILIPFRRRKTSNCALRFSFLRQSFFPLVSTVSASSCEKCLMKNFSLKS